MVKKAELFSETGYVTLVTFYLIDCLVCRLGMRLPLLLEVGSLRTSFIELYIINCCSPKNGNIMKVLVVIGIIQ